MILDSLCRRTKPFYVDENRCLEFYGNFDFLSDKSVQKMVEQVSACVTIHGPKAKSISVLVKCKSKSYFFTDSEL